MKLKNKIYFFLFIVVLSFFIDKYLYLCEKNESISINLLHIIHHFLSNYLFFGSLIFGYYKYHLFVVTVVILHWLLNDDKCFITVIYNKSCNFDTDTRHRDLAYHIQKLVNLNMYTMLFLIVVYDIYMIFKK